MQRYLANKKAYLTIWALFTNRFINQTVLLWGIKKKCHLEKYEDLIQEGFIIATFLVNRHYVSCLPFRWKYAICQIIFKNEFQCFAVW